MIKGMFAGGILSGVLVAVGVTTAQIAIVGPSTAQTDAGWVMAIDELKDALVSSTHGSAGVSVVYRTASDPLPPGDLILVGLPSDVPGTAWSPSGPEAYEISQITTLPDRQALVVEGSARGMMYGLFKLAETIRLQQDPWQVQLTASPAFPLRIFSEEGQLLDLPDIGYYSDTTP
jgi:alpha-glucuronidase